jgi:hypothetical protein
MERVATFGGGRNGRRDGERDRGEKKWGFHDMSGFVEGGLDLFSGGCPYSGIGSPRLIVIRFSQRASSLSAS